MICLNSECEAQDRNECVISDTVKVNEMGICAFWYAQACSESFPPVIGDDAAMGGR